MAEPALWDRYSPGAHAALGGTFLSRVGGSDRGAGLHRQWAAALGDVYLAGAPSASRFAIGKSVSTALTAADVHLDDFIYQPQAARGRVDMTHGWDRLLSAVHGPA